MIVQNKAGFIIEYQQALDQYKSVKIGTLLFLTCEKAEEDFDGHRETRKCESHLSSNIVHTSTRLNTVSASDQRTRDMATHISFLIREMKKESRWDQDGELFSTDKFAIDMF